MKSSLEMKNIDKPEKIYLANTNLMYTTEPKIGNVRESFFMNQLANYYVIKGSLDNKGDFYLEQKYLSEVGGKNKTFKQIKDVSDSLLALDEMEIGHGVKIPLWLFGFLY